jgi:hypothetical protein
MNAALLTILQRKGGTEILQILTPLIIELDALREVADAARASMYAMKCNENSLTGRHIDGCEKCELETALKNLDEARPG